MIWLVAALVAVALVALFVIRRSNGPHSLAAAGRTDDLKELLARSPEAVNERDGEGQTPAHVAAKYNQPATLSALLDAGSLIDERAHSGPTPLVLAAAFNCLEAVDILIKRGADLDVPDDQGVTALHFAARLGNFEIVRMLLRAGAQVNMKAGGNTVLDLAMEASQNELAAEIRAAGGRTGNDVRMRDLKPPKSLGKHILPSVLEMLVAFQPLVEATEKAQRSLDNFRKLYLDHPNRSAVKFEEEETNEFVWGRVTAFDSDNLTVRIVSNPLTFADSGETKSIAWSKVTDWLVEESENKLIGGYSLRAMCSLVREEYGFLDAKYADIERALAPL